MPSTCPRVTACTPISQCMIWIEFDDGSAGYVDLRRIMEIGPFRALRDREKFAAVRVANGTVTWDDPELTLNREVLFGAVKSDWHYARQVHLPPLPEEDHAFQRFMKAAVSAPAKRRGRRGQ